MIVCLQTIDQIIVALYLVNHDIISKATIDLIIVALLLYYVIETPEGVTWSPGIASEILLPC